MADNSGRSYIVYPTFCWQKQDGGSTDFVPIISIPADELELRTEVIALFERLHLSAGDLVFSSDVCFKDYEPDKVKVTLVDHNVSQKDELKDLICQIIGKYTSCVTSHAW